MGAETSYTTVPRVVGYKLEDAKMLLNAAGIRIGNVTRVDTDGQSTEVLSQSLAEGSTVENGTTIDLVIVTEKESSESNIELMIPLPNVPYEVSMRATLNGVTVLSEHLIPTEEDGYWTISVPGEGIGTLSIYYNDQLYRAYSVNFNERTTMMIADNSDQFGG